MIVCPSCRGEDVEYVRPGCLDGEGGTIGYAVCANCDYGINEHTEGLCHCPKGTP